VRLAWGTQPGWKPEPCTVKVGVVLGEEVDCLGVVGEGEAAHGKGHQPGGEHVLLPLGKHLVVEEEDLATVMMAGARQ
jgi:hypothetical protein